MPRHRSEALTAPRRTPVSSRCVPVARSGWGTPKKLGGSLPIFSTALGIGNARCSVLQHGASVRERASRRLPGSSLAQPSLRSIEQGIEARHARRRRPKTEGPSALPIEKTSQMTDTNVGDRFSGVTLALGSAWNSIAFLNSRSFSQMCPGSAARVGSS